ncbi:MAG: hypothetical protein ACE5EX_07415, partial [Phycisphaerae bacterium]
IMTLTSAITLLIAAVAFLVLDLVSFRSRMIRELSVLSGAIASNSTAAMSFDDALGARDALAPVGAGLRPDQTNPGYGNVLLRNHGSPVSVSGSDTFGNTGRAARASSANPDGLHTPMMCGTRASPTSART